MAFDLIVGTVMIVGATALSAYGCQLFWNEMNLQEQEGWYADD